MTADLLQAVEQHEAKRVAELLSLGADPNAPNPRQPSWRPLMSAIDELPEGGPIDSVVLLIRAGASVNAADADGTAAPLLVAVMCKQLEAARLLLAAGADPNVRDDEGDSALRLSVEKGDREMAALLLTCGAAKTINDFGGFSGKSALGRAVSNLDAPMVELLLNAGADPDLPDLDSETARDHLAHRKDGSDAESWNAVALLLAR